MATVTLPDDLAERVEPFGQWLPVVLEISLLGLKTQASRTAGEIIAFLSTGPSTDEVAAHQASARSQERMSRLLTLNQAGLLGEAEAEELDELLRLENLLITLKAELDYEEA